MVVFFVLFCFARGRAKDKFGGVDSSYFYTLCSPLFSIFYACFSGKTGYLMSQISVSGIFPDQGLNCKKMEILGQKRNFRILVFCALVLR